MPRSGQTAPVGSTATSGGRGFARGASRRRRAYHLRMPRLLLLALAAAVAVVIGNTFGWKWILAPLLSYAMIRWAFATLRSMVHGGQGLAAGEDDGPAPVSADERTLFWCEECGTEVLLLVRGTSRAPSHCGQRMHERTEILS